VTTAILTVNVRAQPSATVNVPPGSVPAAVKIRSPHRYVWVQSG
jgi:hypothetical protein